MWGSPASRLPSAVESRCNDIHWDIHSTALGNRLTGLPHNEPAAEVSFVYLFRQSQQQMFDASKYVLGPCF